MNSKHHYILIKFISLLASLIGNAYCTNDLANYDSVASSSSFGEPFFRLEPPKEVIFSNTKGATIPCLASGSPRPTITWYSTSSGGVSDWSPFVSVSSELLQTRLVSNVTNLRQIVHNGAALRLLPFKESDFRQDVHSTEYKCVASNHLATIQSTNVLVQVVMSSSKRKELEAPAGQEEAAEQQARVNDEFVTLGSAAVFKCGPPTGANLFLASSPAGALASLGGSQAAGLEGTFSHLLEWFTSDNLRIGAGETAKGPKFIAFRSGELHINNVDSSDLRRTYGCRLRNDISQRSASSSGLAQLIVTDSLESQQAAGNNRQQQQPQVVHTVSQIIAEEAGERQAQRTGRSSLADQLEYPPAGAEEPDYQEHEDPARESRVLLPCAVRMAPASASGAAAGELRWFYQPPLGRHLKMVSVEQLAASMNLKLVSQHQQQQGHNGSFVGNRRPPAQAGEPASRIIVGPSYLALEWPRRELSGRYICQLVVGGESGRTMCDINVIIRQPLRLRVEFVASQAAEGLASPNWLDYPNSMMALSEREPERGPAGSWWFRRAVDWLGGLERPLPGVSEEARASRSRRSSPGNLLAGAGDSIQLRSRGLVPAPNILLVSQRLQLNCLASGYPVESVKWFRNGQLINTQSSSDFQVEITNSNLFQQQAEGSGERLSGQPQLLSSLVIRQLQPKNAGLNMFECMAQNGAGDRARAGLPVFVAERQLVEMARGACPLPANSSGLELDSPESSSSGTDQQPDYQQRGLFMRLNPLRRALVLEWEPAELVCPARLAGGGQPDWRRLVGELDRRQAPSSAEAQERERASRNFNQLFIGAGSGGGGLGKAGASSGGGAVAGGDARFVINGSSLQIRSPSKRHDEGLYLCRQLPGEQRGMLLAELEEQQQASKLTRAGQPSEQTDNKQPHASLAGPVHQSSLASPWSPACSLKLAELFLPPASPAGQQAPATPNSNTITNGRQTSASALAAEGMSSISIRIVGKPKIDPFEFSKNLEEGMRAVVVCAVVSGESPVDITWFKDGRLLLEDEQTSLDQVNGFSSTLTFHQIKPSHSGYYTCIAANAFASTNHTSRLLVNEAAYFIEAPKNTQAVLNSNVMVNCRAGGQPTPQIRWRKLVAVGGNGALLARPGAPSAGGPLKPPEQFYAPDLLEFAAGQQQMAPAGRKFEFRIITSNSHIQILENGSMIIKDVELADASRYVCQAFNGINPSLSEMIELQVLSPAQFDVHYETVSVKRDSMIKFSCAPKGDQPMQIEWHKEGHLLAAAELGADSEASKQQLHSKYTELATLVANQSSEGQQQLRQRQSNLIIRQQPPPAASKQNSAEPDSPGPISSELLINYADRSDTGVFSCFARNAFGKDELSYRLIVQEAPDVPANVSVQNVLSSSLKLSWTAPFDGNLPISQFVVEYRKVVGLAQQQAAVLAGPLEEGSPARQHSEWVRLVVAASKLAGAGSSGPAGSQLESGPLLSPSSLVAGQPQQAAAYSMLLRQLAAKSTYHIRLAAVNAIGQSGFSGHLTVTTAEELPSSRPNDLRAQPLSSSAMKLLWRGPAVVDEQAPIKGYYVSHRKLGPEPGSASGPHYPALVKESGQAGSGWISSSSVPVNNSTDFLPADEEPLGATGMFLGSRARQDKAGQPAAVANAVGLNYEFTLNNLEKNSKYEFRVQAYNSMGVGPASETFGQTLKFDRPGQPQLKLVAARKQSFEVKWSLANNEQPLMGFSLFYKCEFDDWQEIQLGLIYQYVIENLRCGNKYQIYLSAFNMVGRSDPSDVLSARTEGTVPIAPDKSQFYQANITEVILDLSSWQSGGCPINSFMIQYKRLHDSNWYILSEGSSSFAASEKVPITNLAPASWYKLLVTASNEAGPTNAEYVFSTLDAAGQPIAPSMSMIEQERAHSARNSMLSGLHQLLSSSNSQGRQSDRHSIMVTLTFAALLAMTILGAYSYYSARSSSGGGSPAGTRRNKEPPELYGSEPKQLRSSLSLQRSDQEFLASQQQQQMGKFEEREQLLAAHQQPMAWKQHLQSGSTGERQPIEHYVHHQPLGQQSMLDSFMSGAFLSAGAGNQQQQQQQPNSASLRLLQPGNMFHSGSHQSASSGNSNCTNSSSLSTHSTQCFEQSSQGSSSGCGAKAKLQLIDEMVADEQQPEAHFQLYQQQAPQLDSPQQPSQIYAGALQRNHVNLLANCQLESNFSSAQQPPPGNHVDANLILSELYANEAHTPRLISSTSFASSADLLQRQDIYYQQQQPQQAQPEPAAGEEPAYQRLDKFQLMTYATGSGNNYHCSKQHCASGIACGQLRSQTLKFQPSHSRAHEEHSKTFQRHGQLPAGQRYHLESQSKLRQEDHCA